MNCEKIQNEEIQILVFQLQKMGAAQLLCAVIKKTNRKQYKPNIWFFLKSHLSKHILFPLFFHMTAADPFSRILKFETVGKCSFFFNEFLKGRKRFDPATWGCRKNTTDISTLYKDFAQKTA